MRNQDLEPDALDLPKRRENPSLHDDTLPDDSPFGSYATLIEDLCELENGELSEWEAKFVSSVADQHIEQGRSLSPKQRRLIEDLYERTIL